MVEYGMSRFKKERAHTKAQTDKPITILTLVTFVEREKLTEILATCSQLVKCSLLWHWHCIWTFGAYLLACTFSAPKWLLEVFEFVDSNRWNAMHKDKLTELVKILQQLCYKPTKISGWTTFLAVLYKPWHIEMAPEPRRVRFLLPCKHCQPRPYICSKIDK